MAADALRVPPMGNSECVGASIIKFSYVGKWCKPTNQPGARVVCSSRRLGMDLCTSISRRLTARSQSRSGTSKDSSRTSASLPTDPITTTYTSLNASRIFRVRTSVPRTELDRRPQPTLEIPRQADCAIPTHRLMPDSAAIKFGVTVARRHVPPTIPHQLSRGLVPWRELRKRVECGKKFSTMHTVEDGYYISRVGSDEALTPITLLSSPTILCWRQRCEVIYLSRKDRDVAP